MSRLIFVFIFATIFSAEVHSARILGVFPIPSISHQVVFRELILELVNKGHEVVTVTPDPAFKGKTPPKNLREIDMSASYQIFGQMFMEATKQASRGVILSMEEMNKMMPNGMMRTLYPLFDHPEVKALTKEEEKFDLVIVEAYFSSPLIFSHIFNAPAILFSSAYGVPLNFNTVGSVMGHPKYYPHFFRSKLGDLSMIENLKEICSEWEILKADYEMEKEENRLVQEHFGKSAPSIRDLQKNVKLLFLNIHPLFDGNRPVPPGVVYLGATHLKPVKELPQDLKSYLDSSKRGVIYVSMGSNVRPSLMDKEFLDAFIKAFEALPYDILWKFDGDNLENVPKNVKVMKWFPQRDLLGHPNIKAFVTQGGLQSTDEAIDATVPLIGIPILGDQWYNVHKYQELGIGIKIDSYTMTSEDLVKAVAEAVNNSSYKENMRNIKAVMQDQPMKPIERAVWWTEYVLRHKDSSYLFSAAAGTTWAEYYMLDLLVKVAITTSAITIVVVFVLYRLVSSVFGASEKGRAKKVKSR